MYPNCFFVPPPPHLCTGLLSYPCFLCLDPSGNIALSNSGCDTVVFLDKSTGHVVATHTYTQPAGVLVTDKCELVVTSTGKHCLSIF